MRDRMSLLHYVLTADPWLAGYLGGEAYRLASPADGLPGDRHPLHTCQARPVPVFIYAKIPTTWITAIEACETEGFRLVDTNLTLEKTVEVGALPARSPIGIRPARPDDRAAVVELARHGFEYSRFHLDPHIPRPTADAVKAGWVDSFFAGKRGEAMLVAVAGNQPVGFLQLLYPDAETIVIDLIAVAPTYRGQGVAGAMIGVAQKAPGRTRVKVGTQAANISSLRLYEKLGFRLIDSSYVLHFHNALRRQIQS